MHVVMKTRNQRGHPHDRTQIAGTGGEKAEPGLRRKGHIIHEMSGTDARARELDIRTLDHPVSNASVEEKRKRVGLGGGQR